MTEGCGDAGQAVRTVPQRRTIPAVQAITHPSGIIRGALDEPDLENFHMRTQQFGAAVSA